MSVYDSGCTETRRRKKSRFMYLFPYPSKFTLFAIDIRHCTQENNNTTDWLCKCCSFHHARQRIITIFWTLVAVITKCFLLYLQFLIFGLDLRMGLHEMILLIVAPGAEEVEVGEHTWQWLDTLKFINKSQQQQQQRGERRRRMREGVQWETRSIRWALRSINMGD